MRSVFQLFLDKGFTYNYQNGPNVIRTEEQALAEGVNCIGLMHLLLQQLFNVSLPNNLRVLEIFHDNPYFTSVTSLDDLQIGDILFLGRKSLPDYVHLYKPEYDRNGTLLNEEESNKIIGEKYAGLHTVMFTGERNSNNPQVIDIQKAVGEVRIWALQDLMSNERYENLYGIKRLMFN